MRLRQTVRRALALSAALAAAGLSSRALRAETPPAQQAAVVALGLDDLLRTASRQQDELDGFVSVLGRLKLSGDGGAFFVGKAAAREYCLNSPMTTAAVDPKELKTFYACKALAAGDPAVCLSLRGAQDDQSDCRGIMRDLALARSLITSSPDFEVLCRKRAAELELRGDPAVLDAGCRGLPAHPTVKELCGEMIRRFPKEFPDLPACLGKLGLYRGEGCAYYQDFDYQKALCATIAAYRKAHEGRSAELCAQEYPCRLLMGDRNACDDHLSRWKRERCGETGGGVSNMEGTAQPSWFGPLIPHLAGAVALAAAQPLDDGQRQAAERLHRALGGKERVDLIKTAADAFLIRSAQLDEILGRAKLAAELLKSTGHAAGESENEFSRLAARVDESRKRYRAWEEAARASR